MPSCPAGAPARAREGACAPRASSDRRDGGRRSSPVTPARGHPLRGKRSFPPHGVPKRSLGTRGFGASGIGRRRDFGQRITRITTDGRRCRRAPARHSPHPFSSAYSSSFPNSVWERDGGRNSVSRRPGRWSSPVAPARGHPLRGKRSFPSHGVPKRSLGTRGFGASGIGRRRDFGQRITRMETDGRGCRRAPARHSPHPFSSAYSSSFPNSVWERAGGRNSVSRRPGRRPSPVAPARGHPLRGKRSFPPHGVPKRSLGTRGFGAKGFGARGPGSRRAFSRRIARMDTDG